MNKRHCSRGSVRSSTVITGPVFSLARIFQGPLWVSEVTLGTPTSSCNLWQLLGIKDCAIWQVKVKRCFRKPAYAHPLRQAAALGPTKMLGDPSSGPGHDIKEEASGPVHRRVCSELQPVSGRRHCGSPGQRDL